MKKPWNKIKKFIEHYILYKNQTLMSKFCVFSSILVILPVLSVGIITYKYSSFELEEEFTQSSQKIIEQVELHVEYYLQDFEITSLKIINSPEMGNLLRLETSSEYDRTLSDPALKVLKNSEYSRNDISNITVFLDNGIIIDSLRERNYYPAINIKDEYWYSSVPGNGMVMLVSRTLKLKDKELPVISLVRRLYNPHTLKPVGMLIIDINFKRIEEISKMVTLGKDGYFFILDSEGHYVYHPKYSKLGNKVEFMQLTNLESGKSGSVLIDNNRKELVSYSLSPKLGWSFFTAAPYQDLRVGIQQIRTAITWTIFISLIFAYLVGFYSISKSIVRPIHRLRSFMKEVEIGHLNGRVKVESNDEIGQLTAGFNKSVERLSNLLEEVYVSKLKEAEMTLNKTETELKMLQSQINPHFLYNSLETIRGMALEEGRENIANISSSLGKLLRYNLRNSLPTVSLREEIKFCEMYLKIQMIRFEDRFEYFFDIPDDVMDFDVVKFSLQPIVENCFMHSIGENSKKIKITINAQLLSKSSFNIRITDTGVGIKEEVLKELKEKLRNNSTSLGGQHIGIMNVHQRIRYLFGSEYGITINSTRGLETEVNIHLPIVDGKEVKE
ncbi:sensor histidine kinase [Psychrobacillus sp. FJAT-51614]|uniref:Sensor histidine kinase n=2 Tax=Psychrobacillus mangrovi TaxID=3117745 RepID=A0ABU8F0X9_9BACI